MTKQRIIGILTLLSVLVAGALTVLKGGAIDYATVIPGLLGCLTAILHPVADAPAK